MVVSYLAVIYFLIFQKYLNIQVFQKLIKANFTFFESLLVSGRWRHLLYAANLFKLEGLSDRFPGSLEGHLLHIKLVCF